VRVTDDPAQASRILDLGPSVPALVWGRDEGHTGDMWNSNSVISWLIASAGLDVGRIQPPTGGRAPGWQAGLEIAARDAGRALGRDGRRWSVQPIRDLRARLRPSASARPIPR
jgi:hypothetical protein